VPATASQSDAEGGFRQLKDPKVVSFSPMWHWTDQKIRVHVSYCVTALAVAHLMRRQTAQAGLPLSVRELLGTWPASKKPCCSTPQPAGAPRPPPAHRHDPTQQQLYDLFDLTSYAPTDDPVR